MGASLGINTGHWKPTQASLSTIAVTCADPHDDHLHAALSLTLNIVPSGSPLWEQPYFRGVSLWFMPHMLQWPLHVHK